MNLPARAHPLHDLLTEVAPLTEMERARLVRLLRQVPLADVLPVAGPPVLNADDPECFRRGWDSARRFQASDQCLAIVHGRDDVEPGPTGEAGADPQGCPPPVVHLLALGRR